MKKKLLALTLTLAMLASIFPSAAFAAEYDDISEHWAKDSIETWSKYGVLKGYDGSFSPNDSLTRGQLAVILARLLALPEAESGEAFGDVPPEAWYADAINRCASAGILLGEGGNAVPERAITREEAAVMLCRALGIESTDGTSLDELADADEISEYARGYIAAMLEAGYIKGREDGKFAAGDTVTRAETVAILDRIVTHYAHQDGETVDASDGALVLVVAKNVEIINAPVGTKVLIFGGEGLRVNGETIKQGGHYVVPEAKNSGDSESAVTHTHVYTESVTKEATCIEHGEKTYSCICGNSYVEKTPRIPHDFVEEPIVAPDCENGGNSIFTCSMCGESYPATYAPLGHSWSTESFTPNGNHETHQVICTRCSGTASRFCKYIILPNDDPNRMVFSCTDCGDRFEVSSSDVARIKGDGYTSLSGALAAATPGDTVTLLTDIEVTEQITINKKIYLDGAGHTIKANNENWSTNDSEKHLLEIETPDDNNNIYIWRVTLDSNHQACGLQTYNSRYVVLSSVTLLNSREAGLIVNNSVVTGSDLVVAGSVWGSVNVDKGNAVFCVEHGSDLRDALQIWSELMDSRVVRAEGYTCNYYKSEDGREFLVWSNRTPEDEEVKEKDTATETTGTVREESGRTKRRRWGILRDLFKRVRG